MSDQLSSLNEFKLQNFQHKRAFSSFLPGIAGLRGIPMWVFYVNRGQGIAGFGVESKDHPLMEYQCAQRAYQCTEQMGFRTFLKGKRGTSEWAYEPFGPTLDRQVRRTMTTRLNEFEIEEINETLGIKVNVLYFLLPNEPFAALVRQVTFSNIGQDALKLEVLDGLPALCSYGIDEMTLKHMGRTIEAWIEVINHPQGLPFFHIKASADDKLHVEVIKAGNFAFSFKEDKLLPAVVDPQVVFGMDTAFGFPNKFRSDGLKILLAETQVTQGRTSCAFFGDILEIPSESARTITGLYGQASQLEVIQAHVKRITGQGVIATKLEEARRIADALTEDVRTESGSKQFDDYCRQNYLDNVMRGGVPLLLGGKHVYHTYSRKHGDLERDYNFFVVAPEFYSQGNGAYRDINQNRRSDVFFHPQAGEFNIRLFMSLIQSDGYNPLTLQGSTFTVDQKDVQPLLQAARKPEELEKLLKGHFTPGQLLATALKADLSIDVEDFFEKLFAKAEQHLQAVHGEGYWCDHWSYNLDLVEACLTIYPEEREHLLFDSMLLPFFDNAVHINPRSERFVLDGENARQFNVVVKDDQKEALITARTGDARWSRSQHGKGEIFRVSLVSKLTLVALLKFVALDPSGFGVQMEGGKPGWYDALNGMPALFGSSMPDSYELLRLLNFLSDLFEDTKRPVKLPVEAVELANVVDKILSKKFSTFEVWEKCSDAVESYRETTRPGFDGTCVERAMTQTLICMRNYLKTGLEHAEVMAGEIPPTYFIHHVRGFEKTGRNDEQGRPLIRVTSFEPQPLPFFLEGPVRRLRSLDAKSVAELYGRIRKSSLYDRKLNMYRLNASLESMPHTIGRARAFTPGWLENESIWMHMDFKYILELLRSGLYQEFFAEFRAHLPAFMDADVYGRSPLENSSFIASSAHPDPTMHGNGFVARLSGSTAEFLSMWVIMTMGHAPFQFEGGELKMKVHPILPGWLFKEDGSFIFKMLGCCDVTLHNPMKKDTFNLEPQSLQLQTANGKKINLQGSELPPPYAGMMREGKIKTMDVNF
jgi:hypothetical protein